MLQLRDVSSDGFLEGFIVDGRRLIRQPCRGEVSCKNNPGIGSRLAGRFSKTRTCTVQRVCETVAVVVNRVCACRAGQGVLAAGGVCKGARIVAIECRTQGIATITAGLRVSVTIGIWTSWELDQVELVERKNVRKAVAS